LTATNNIELDCVFVIKLTKNRKWNKIVLSSYFSL